VQPALGVEAWFGGLVGAGLGALAGVGHGDGVGRAKWDVDE
jgi:hypothetical protein